jgi:hypothetical protein
LPWDLWQHWYKEDSESYSFPVSKDQNKTSFFEGQTSSWKKIMTGFKVP